MSTPGPTRWADAPFSPAVRPTRPRGGSDRTTSVNPFVTTATDAVSTFGLDVDTGSYTMGRRTLLAGGSPDPATGRVRSDDIGQPLRDDGDRRGVDLRPRCRHRVLHDGPTHPSRRRFARPGHGAGQIGRHRSTPS